MKATYFVCMEIKNGILLPYGLYKSKKSRKLKAYVHIKKKSKMASNITEAKSLEKQGAIQIQMFCYWVKHQSNNRPFHNYIIIWNLCTRPHDAEQNNQKTVSLFVWCQTLSKRDRKRAMFKKTMFQLVMLNYVIIGGITVKVLIFFSQQFY